jgi:hypothetical protein
MAGEWLMYDVCLPQKPEVLELVDATGLETDRVVGRMLMLWGWASLNCEDGRAKISLRLLSRVVGGDEGFWRAVEAVGWLEIDAEAGTVAIPGWDRRFSNAAKSRALASSRAERQRARAPERTTPCAEAHDPVRSSAPKRRKRGERTSSSSSPPEAAPGASEPEPQPEPQEASWEALRAAWRAGPGRAWKLPDAPEEAGDRLQEAGWWPKAQAAIGELRRCRYFEHPVTLPQFLAAGFVDKILGGQFDNPKTRSGHGGGGGRLDDRPPAQGWSGDDAARLEATKRKLVEQLRAEVA